MNGKKLTYLAAILIIAIAVLYLGDKLGKKAPSDSELQFIPGINKDVIGSVLLTEGTKKIKIRKQGEVWMVSQPASSMQDEKSTDNTALLGSDSASATDSNGSAAKEYPTDSAAITSILEKVTALKKNVKVSENPEKQKIFEVDSAKGIIVELADNSGKALGSFVIGKSGADYNSHYVRSMGSNSVYLAAGGIRNACFTDLKRWRNKEIVRFDKATAKGVTLVKKDGSMITLAHSDSGNPWMIIEPAKNPAKTEAVDEILSKLSMLNATEFQDEVLADTAMGFDKPELGVTVSFNNGSSRNVIFGKKSSDNKYWVKTDDKDQIYLISEYYFNQINKKLDDLKGEPLVKPVEKDSKK